MALNKCTNRAQVWGGGFPKRQGERIYEMSPVAMAVSELTGRIVTANSACQRITGYTEAELRELTLLDLMQEADPASTLARLRQLGTGEVRQYQAEKRFLCKDRSLIWVRLTVVPTPAARGLPQRVLAVVEDITGRRRAEKELRRSHDQLRTLAARVQSVREEERTGVARWIHDELGQALTGIKMDLTFLTLHPPKARLDRIRRLQAILKDIDHMIQSAQRVSAELRPGMLDELGLVAAVECGARRFAQRTGTKCALEFPREDLAIEPEVSTALFRIFQEAVANIARHAEATEVSVRLAKGDDGLRLEVRDDGKGFREAQLSPGGSLGILGMRERALLLNGRLTIRSAPGEGATVTAWIPIGQAKAPGNG
jgi:PAS domain S-box-containing protein